MSHDLASLVDFITNKRIELDELAKRRAEKLDLQNVLDELDECYLTIPRIAELVVFQEGSEIRFFVTQSRVDVFMTPGYLRVLYRDLELRRFTGDLTKPYERFVRKIIEERDRPPPF